LTLARRFAGLATVGGLKEAVLHDILRAGKNPLAASCNTSGFRLWNRWLRNSFSGLGASAGAHKKNE
jgi:hypothetical protein